jgi:hypothetical protein
VGAADGTIFGSFKLVDHGKDTHRFNLVFLSDGFRANEIPEFMGIVGQVLAEMRVTRPFQALWPNLNAHQINVGSVDSGADVPTAGVTARTFFDASFGKTCHERLLEVNDRAVLKVCKQFVTGYTAPIVIVNAPQYGGSSGDAITFSVGVGKFLARAAMHELGHFIAGLADEYDSKRNTSAVCPQAKTHVQYAGPEPADPNITRVRDGFNLKWGDLVGVGTPLPTLEVPTSGCANPTDQPSPVDPGTVGLFEGAGYFNCGLFRSEFDCRLRHHVDEYCEVCARAIRDEVGNWAPRPAELSRDIWTPGWDLITAIDIDGAPHVVSYKPSSGSIAIDKVRPDGSGTDPVLGSTWSTGWTSIVPLQLGGAPHLLLYKSGTGRMEIDVVENSGQDVNAVSSDTWTTGWTSMVPFTLGGEQFLFSYKQGSGSVSIDSVRDDASGTDPVLGATWATDWSHHAIWEQPWGASLVSYRDGDGSLDVDRISDSGQTTDTVISTTVDAGFSSLVRLDWHGEPVFLLHDLSNGVSRFEHLHDPGPTANSPANVSFLGPVVGKIGNAFFNAGWNSLTPFTLSGQPHWLAYNGNVAVIDRID